MSTNEPPDRDKVMARTLLMYVAGSTTSPVQGLAALLGAAAAYARAFKVDPQDVRNALDAAIGANEGPKVNTNQKGST